MAQGCRQENHANAGLELGAFIGGAARDGRDKLTLALPPSLASLGLWIEQLIAESTGKHGKGALPVVDEPLGAPGRLRQRPRFVAIATERDAPDPETLRRARRSRLSPCFGCRLASTGSAPSSSAGSSRRRSPARHSASIRSTSRTSRKRKRKPKSCSRHSNHAARCRSLLPPPRTADDIRESHWRHASFAAIHPERLRRVSLLSSRRRRRRTGDSRRFATAIREKFKVATTFGRRTAVSALDRASITKADRTACWRSC